MVLQRCTRGLIALAVGVSTAVPLALSSSVPAAARCAAATTRTVEGTVQGEDGRFVNALIGVALHDGAGRTIGLDGCVKSGYAAVPRVNASVSANGATSGAGLTKNWKVTGIPANAINAWVEVYPKAPDHKTNQTRYGQAMRRALRLPARNIPLRLPLNCGLSEGGVTGDSGAIGGYATYQGRRVAVERVRAWTEAPDSSRYIMGWNMGRAGSNGTYVIPNLEPGQWYSVWVTAAGGRLVKRLHIPVVPCKTTPLNVSMG